MDDEEPAIICLSKKPPTFAKPITAQEQLDQWVMGWSIHNTSGDGECCPDFSCCQPDLLAPKAARVAFRDANDEERLGMLGHFLSAGLGKAMEGKKDPPAVYIAGDAEKQQ